MITRLAIGFTLLFQITAPAEAENWAQFRGPNAAGRYASTVPLPTEIGPHKNVIWRTPVPAGHSSPVIYGDRIYLTAVRDERLATLAVDRNSGEILWETPAPECELEEIHTIGSHAQSSVTTDGEHIISFFGSFGLLCYDATGQELWRIPMGPFSNSFGAGSSPILVDHHLILNQDHDIDSFLTAIDVRNGNTIWRTNRNEFPRGYATPIIWSNDGERQIVVSGTLRVVGYDFDTGAERWTVRGISRITNMTPVVGDDGTLYVAAWAPGGDDTNRIEVPTFDSLIDRGDENGDSRLQIDEVPVGPLSIRYGQIDRDKDGAITRAEFDSMRAVFHAARNVLLAIRPGGSGDITDTHVAWRYDRSLPYVPSPVVYQDLLFMVKDGGIVSCVAADSGEPHRRSRVPGTAAYYASPVAGDGKIYLVSQRGELTVITAEADWKEIATAEFEEDVYATPALLDGHIYLRTTGHLYCFGTH